MTDHNRFITLRPGTRVAHENRTIVIDRAIDSRTLIVRDEATGELLNVQADELGDAPAADAIPAPPLADTVVDRAAYERARMVEDVIKSLKASAPHTEAQVETAARQLGMSRPALYRWMRRYDDAPDLSSLIPARRGPAKGKRKLDPHLELIIEAAINDTHMTRRRRRATRTCVEVRLKCRTAGLAPPHDNTVRARIAALSPQKAHRARGQEDRAKLLEPIRGSYVIERPLEVAQMDHCLGDVELVDNTMRLPLGRPWITLIIDVCTRMILGAEISMQHPSAFTAGRCVAHALLPKKDYLRKLGVSGHWDAWGQITSLHMDNAREFRGTLMKASCEANGINPIYRPVKVPHYGGHIERLMGVTARELNDMLGATFANTAERKGTAGSADATMTLSEFEAYFVDWIVNVYHRKKHSGLDDMTPDATWREMTTPVPSLGQPVGLQQRLPRDPERLRIDFLPSEHRSITRKGILIHGIYYWDDIFRGRIGEKDPDNRRQLRKFLVRFDPRDLSRIWLLDPDSGHYRRIGTWNRSRPPVSLWEWRAIQKFRKDRGDASYNEDEMFDTLERRREDMKLLVTRHKAARRQIQMVVDVNRRSTKAAPQPQKTEAEPETAAAPETREYSPITDVEF